MLSKSQDRLQHRHPARQTCGVRSKGPAIRSLIDPEQLCVDPESLGRKEMPLYPTAVLMRVAELPPHPRSAAIEHHLFRIDKTARRELGPVVVCGCERKQAVGFEVIQPTHEVLSVDRKPI